MRFSSGKEIHCWGGLGSQLFGIALALDLRHKYSVLKLVFHNSGVTRRDLEAKEFIERICNFSVVDDYSHEEKVKSNRSRFTLRSAISKIAKLTGVLNEANTDHQFYRIYPWTKQIRGHYSYRRQKLSTLSFMRSEFLKIYGSQCQVEEELVVHYRLDDIVNLPGKTVISKERVAGEISKLTECSKVKVFSDSPKRVEDDLKSLIAKELFVSDAETEFLVASALKSKFFVGTVSKVSFWIVFLRISHDKNSFNLMPVESRVHLQNALGELSVYESLSFY